MTRPEICRVYGQIAREITGKTISLFQTENTPDIVYFTYSSTYCLFVVKIFFVFLYVYDTSGVYLKGVAESSVLSKDEPLTPNIDEVMAV